MEPKQNQQKEIRPIEGSNILYNLFGAGFWGLLTAIVISYVPYGLRFQFLMEQSGLFVVLGILSGLTLAIVRFRQKSHQAVIITDENIIIQRGISDTIQIPKEAVKNVVVVAVRSAKSVYIETSDGLIRGASSGWSLQKARQIKDAISAEVNLPPESTYDNTTVGSPAFKRIITPLLIIFALFIILAIIGAFLG